MYKCARIRIKALGMLLLWSVIWAGPQISYGQSELRESLALARQYYGQEEYRKALRELKPLLDKGGPQRAYQLARDSYAALEEWQEIEDLAGRFGRIHGNKAEKYLVDEIYALEKQEQTSKAEKLREQLLDRVESRPSLAYSLGKTLQKRGYPELALRTYQTAEEANNSLQFAYQKALVYGELGDIQKMYGMYVAMVEQNPAYLSTVKTLLTRAIGEDSDPENLDYLKKMLIKKIQKEGPERLNEILIHLFMQEENFSGAFLQLKALIKREKAEPSQLMRLARVSRGAGNYDLAQRIYSFVEKEFAGGITAQEALLGRLYTRKLALEEDGPETKDPWRELLSDFEEAIPTAEGTPYQAPAVRHWAEIAAFRLDSTQQAITFLQDWMENQSGQGQERAEALILLGDVQLFAGDRYEAILNYKRAESGRESAPLGQKAKFKRAQAAYYVGDFTWAQSLFDVLKRSTSKKMANDAMHYALLISENTALDTTTEALELYARADLLQFRDRRDSALNILQRMPIAFPEHAILDDALYLRAQIHQEAQNDSLALQYYRQLLEEHPQSILIDDALIRMARLLEDKEPEKAQELYRQLFVEQVDSFYASEARRRYRILRGDVTE